MLRPRWPDSTNSVSDDPGTVQIGDWDPRLAFLQDANDLTLC